MMTLCLPRLYAMFGDSRLPPIAGGAMKYRQLQTRLRAQA
jgi:hypothetical protein